MKLLEIVLIVDNVNKLKCDKNLAFKYLQIQFISTLQLAATQILSERTFYSFLKLRSFFQALLMTDGKHFIHDKHSAQQLPHELVKRLEKLSAESRIQQS